MTDYSDFQHSRDDDPALRHVIEQGHAKAVETLRGAGRDPKSMWILITLQRVAPDRMGIHFQAGGQGPWLDAWMRVRDIAEENIERSREL